jgi:hypothetical protein
LTPVPRVLRLVALLGLFCGLVLSTRVSYLAWDSWRRGVDFRVYRAAAKIGIEHGWSRLYDLALQRPRIEPLFPAAIAWTPFASPPPVAWITLPLIGASPEAGTVAAWSFLVAIALAAAAAMAAGPRALGWGLLSMAALPATGWEVALGNVAGLLPVSVAGAALLLGAGRDIAAGVVLAAVAFKPQLAWLAPLALLAAGRWRAAAALAGVAGMLALLSVAVIQPAGVGAYVGILHDLSVLADQRRFSLDHQLALPELAGAIRVFTIVAALAAGYRSGPRRPELALTAAVAGSLAVTPYLNVPDLVLCVPVAWWLARAGSSSRWAWAAAAYWVATLLGSFWELPWLLAQLAVVLALAVALPRDVAGDDDHLAGRHGPIGEARARI